MEGNIRRKQVLLAKQQAQAKNVQYRKDFDSPKCIICNSQHVEDPTHMFTACPTTQTMAATACDGIIVSKLNDAYARLPHSSEKQNSPILPASAFWNNHPFLSQQHAKLPLWLAQGAVPVSFNVFNRDQVSAGISPTFSLSS